MTLLKKRGCAGCQPAGEPLAGEGKASPDPLFFPKRHASYVGILIAFLAVTFVAGGHIDFSFLDAAKDFPGGFPGDTKNCFTREGRTQAENAMFDWLSRLLHWRQGNDVIIKGKQTQFIPFNGIYVIARQYQGKTVMTILNGNHKQADMQLDRYAEVIGNATAAKDVITGRTVKLDKKLSLKSRQALILEL